MRSQPHAASRNPMQQLPFFVYGTLKPGGLNYALYLAGITLEELSATLVGAAIYTPGPFPFLTLEPDLAAPDEQAHGCLITVMPGRFPQTMAALDMLEGYTAGGANNLYERIVFPVDTPRGPRHAWVYLASAKALRLIRAGRMRRVVGGVWEAG